MNFIEFLDQIESFEELLPNEALVVVKNVETKVMYNIKEFELESSEDDVSQTLWVHIEEV